MILQLLLLEALGNSINFNVFYTFMYLFLMITEYVNWGKLWFVKSSYNYNNSAVSFTWLIFVCATV